MGNETDPILCADIDSLKWYVCECEIFLGGSGVTGCQRPYIGTGHDIVPGGQLKAWVCNGYDCTDGWTLIFGAGDAQRLIKIFGPYDTIGDAQDANW